MSGAAVCEWTGGQWGSGLGRLRVYSTAGWGRGGLGTGGSQASGLTQDTWDGSSCLGSLGPGAFLGDPAELVLLGFPEVLCARWPHPPTLATQAANGTPELVGAGTRRHAAVSPGCPTCLLA